MKGKILQPQQNNKDQGTDLIRLLCSCGKRVKVSPKFAGKQGKCPRCGRAVQIPSKEVLERKYNEFKNANENLDVFEIPSLPDIQPITTEPAKPKSVLQMGNQDFLETTGELEELFDNDGLEVPQSIVEPIHSFIAPSYNKEDTKYDSRSALLTTVEEPNWDDFLNEKPATSVEPKPVEQKQDEFDIPDELSDNFFEDFAGSSPSPNNFELDPLEPLELDPLAPLPENNNVNISNQAEIANNQAVIAEQEPDFAQAVIAEQEPDFAQAVVAEQEPDFAQAVIAEQEPDFEQAVVAEQEPDFTQAVVAEQEPDFVQPVAVEQEPDFAQPVAVEQEPELAQAVAVEQEPDFAQAVAVESDITNPNDKNAETNEIDTIEEVSSHAEPAEATIATESNSIEYFPQEQEFIEELEEYEDQLRQSEAMEAVSFGKTSEQPKKEFKADIENLSITIAEDSCDELKQGYNALTNMNYDEALQHLSACIATGDDMEVAYFARAILYIRKKQWQIALEDLDNAHSAGYPELEVEEVMNQVRLQIAIQYREMGAYSEALMSLDKIESVNISQEKGKVYLMRAKSYIRTEAWNVALRDLEEAILHNYNKPDVFEERGNIYLRQKDYESAMNNFTAAINHGGKNANIYKSRSEAYFFLNDMNLALQDIKEAEKLTADDPSIFDLEGLIFNELKQYKEADVAFEKSLGLDPNNMTHYFHRAIAYMKRGKYDKAIDDFTRVINSNPKDQVAYLRRAICYQEKKNPNLALARNDFQKVEELEQKSLYRSEHNANITL